MRLRYKIVNFYDEDILGSDDIVYLQNSDWDDWFRFETTYVVMYKNVFIGNIRIGRRGQTERRCDLPFEFTELPADCFSLGDSVNYYENLKKHEDIRDQVLKDLKDIAYDLDLYESVKNEDVTKTSIMRDATDSLVRGQLNRVAHGGAMLTGYSFTYRVPGYNVQTGESFIPVNFMVDIYNNKPASNVHAIVGNNGVGKTTFISHLINALLYENPDNGCGEVVDNIGIPLSKSTVNKLSNIVNISFGVFDDPICECDLNNPLMPYNYIGLVQARINERGERKRSVAYDEISRMFIDSFYEIQTSVTKLDLWHQSIHSLSCDATFNDLNVYTWELRNSPYNVYRTFASNEDYDRTVESYKEWVSKIFRRLSSGHKIILLMLATLIRYVEEKTLVILDEPEEHLHPPLVSAFIRALSDIMVYRNGMAIISTHSPVIIQEIQKNCVWKIFRSGDIIDFSRPRIETYGENLGEIITEVFNYDVMNTGFLSSLQSVSDKFWDYDMALSAFQGRLGKEAKSILRSIMYEKGNNTNG